MELGKHLTRTENTPEVQQRKKQLFPAACRSEVFKFGLLNVPGHRKSGKQREKFFLFPDWSLSLGCSKTQLQKKKEGAERGNSCLCPAALKGSSFPIFPWFLFSHSGFGHHISEQVRVGIHFKQEGTSSSHWCQNRNGSFLKVQKNNSGIISMSYENSFFLLILRSVYLLVLGLNLIAVTVSRGSHRNIFIYLCHELDIPKHLLQGCGASSTRDFPSGAWKWNPA